MESDVKVDPVSSSEIKEFLVQPGKDSLWNTVGRKKEWTLNLRSLLKDFRWRSIETIVLSTMPVVNSDDVVGWLFEVIKEFAPQTHWDMILHWLETVPGLTDNTALFGIFFERLRSHFAEPEVNKVCLCDLVTGKVVTVKKHDAQRVMQEAWENKQILVFSDPIGDRKWVTDNVFLNSEDDVSTTYYITGPINRALRFILLPPGAVEMPTLTANEFGFLIKVVHAALLKLTTDEKERFDQLRSNIDLDVAVATPSYIMTASLSAGLSWFGLIPALTVPFIFLSWLVYVRWFSTTYPLPLKVKKFLQTCGFLNLLHVETLAFSGLTVAFLSYFLIRIVNAVRRKASAKKEAGRHEYTQVGEIVRLLFGAMSTIFGIGTILNVIPFKEYGPLLGDAAHLATSQFMKAPKELQAELEEEKKETRSLALSAKLMPPILVGSILFSTFTLVVLYFTVQVRKEHKLKKEAAEKPKEEAPAPPVPPLPLPDPKLPQKEAASTIATVVAAPASGLPRWCKTCRSQTAALICCGSPTVAFEAKRANKNKKDRRRGGKGKFASYDGMGNLTEPEKLEVRQEIAEESRLLFQEQEKMVNNAIRAAEKDPAVQKPLKQMLDNLGQQLKASGLDKLSWAEMSEAGKKEAGLYKPFGPSQPIPRTLKDGTRVDKAIYRVECGELNGWSVLIGSSLFSVRHIFDSVNKKQEQDAFLLVGDEKYNIGKYSEITKKVELQSEIVGFDLSKLIAKRGSDGKPLLAALPLLKRLVVQEQALSTAVKVSKDEGKTVDVMVVTHDDLSTGIVDSVLGKVAEYTCATKDGMSGAPVFLRNSSGEFLQLVGLHDSAGVDNQHNRFALLDSALIEFANACATGSKLLQGFSTPGSKSGPLSGQLSGPGNTIQSVQKVPTIQIH